MVEQFEHTADVGLRVRAPDLSTLFREAAEGLVALTVERPAAIEGGELLRFVLEQERYDYLLFDWLCEVLHAIETRRFVLERFEVHVASGRLEATARGRAIDPTRDRLGREVKAITYHGLRVEPTGDGWLAELIVDV